MDDYWNNSSSVPKQRLQELIRTRTFYLFMLLLLSEITDHSPVVGGDDDDD